RCGPATARLRARRRVLILPRRPSSSKPWPESARTSSPTEPTAQHPYGSAMPTPRTLRLHASDNVGVAVDAVDAGSSPLAGIVAASRVPKGHKMATAAIARGAPVL